MPYASWDAVACQMPPPSPRGGWGCMLAWIDCSESVAVLQLSCDGLCTCVVYAALPTSQFPPRLYFTNSLIHFPPRQAGVGGGVCPLRPTSVHKNLPEPLPFLCRAECRHVPLLLPSLLPRTSRALAAGIRAAPRRQVSVLLNPFSSQSPLVKSVAIV